MGAVIELEGLPATDREEVLREHMLRAPVPLELRPFEFAEIRVRSSVADFGCIHLLSTGASGAAVVRTGRLARDDTEPSLIVSLLESGTTVAAQDDRLAHLRPGDLVVLTTTAPYASTFNPGTLKHSFQVPLAQLGLPFGVLRTVLARPLGPGHPVAALLAAYLGRLANSAVSFSQAERDCVEQPTIELVRALLTTSVAKEAQGREALGRSIETRVLEYMQLHLADTDLGAPSIAAATGISERYLYTVLGRRGIVLGDWIRENRVEAAARELTRRGSAFVTISSIAHRWGFADHAHFSRVFRALRGVTPSEWRRMHQGEVS